MRELTISDLDLELAEQLPARELMGCPPKNGHGHDGGDRENNAFQVGLVNVAVQNNGDIDIL